MGGTVVMCAVVTKQSGEGSGFLSIECALHGENLFSR